MRWLFPYLKHWPCPNYVRDAMKWKASLASPQSSVFEGYRPWPGAPLPVDPGTWRLKQWRVLGSELRRYRIHLGITVRDIQRAICMPYYPILEEGSGSLEDYDKYFWAAWAYLDEHAHYNRAQKDSKSEEFDATDCWWKL